MSTTTTNYGLIKPELTDSADITFVGQNMDIIDAELKANKSTANSLETTMNNHSGDKGNPHKVTAAQVGLGNVQNVATNDQTPTYTTAGSLTTLTSGEKLSVSFGKIAKAVSDLISHLSNKNNPHGVTAGQISAVSKSGDTMGGDLKIEKSSFPSVRLASTGNGSGAVFQQGENQTTISSQNVSGDSKNYRLLSINNSSLFDLDNALHLTDMVNGVKSNPYTVLHTGNKNLIFTYGTDDLTAGTSKLETGKLHFVYE